MENEKMTERLVTPMSKTMVDAINDYRFEHRCESKSDAVRTLIQAGLDADQGGKSRKGKSK
jgi:metal-responsive CopG/Arc/MetJ family transcriptional regulator